MCVHAKSLQLCQTPCDPMDFSPPGSSVHGMLHTLVNGCPLAAGEEIVLRDGSVLRLGDTDVVYRNP